jgi:hypothetical protein
MMGVELRKVKKEETYVHFTTKVTSSRMIEQKFLVVFTAEKSILDNLIDRPFSLKTETKTFWCVHEGEVDKNISDETTIGLPFRLMQQNKIREGTIGVIERIGLKLNRADAFFMGMEGESLNLYRN